MSRLVPGDDPAVIISAAAEQVGFPPQSIRLLVDSSSTGGTLSAQRVTLLNGVNDANPHHHSHSAELFYVLSGSVQLLVGDRPRWRKKATVPSCPPDLRTRTGGTILRRRSPDRDHTGHRAIQYFRQLARIATGQQAPESLIDVQALYDTFFEESPPWHTDTREVGRNDERTIRPDRPCERVRRGLNRHDAEALRDLLDNGYVNHNPFVSDVARARLGGRVLCRLARRLSRRQCRL